MNDDLLAAVTSGNSGRVKRLLSDPDMNPNITANPTAAKPLLQAVKSGNLEIVKLLLEHPKLDLQPPGSIPPLYMACDQNMVDIVKVLLLDPRLDPNHVEGEYCSAVWITAHEGNLPLMKLLIASGRELNLEVRGRLVMILFEDNQFNVTEVAKVNGHMDMVGLLERYKKSRILTVGEVRREFGMKETFLEKWFGIGLSTCSVANPPDFKEATQVTSICLADSRMTTLPKQLSGEGLVTFPEKLASFTNLTHLDLSTNQLVKIPAFMLEYTSLVSLNLSRSGLEESEIPKLATMISKNTGLTSLRLAGVKLGVTGASLILQALITNFLQKQTVVQLLILEDEPIEKFDGLRMIPVDILQQGVKKTSQFLVDFFKSPNADPIYRSKIMVVGYENVGKTSLIDCLFPILGEFETQGTKRTKYEFKLQGKFLMKYKVNSNFSEPYKLVAVIESRKAEVTPIKKGPGLTIRRPTQQEVLIAGIGGGGSGASPPPPPSPPLFGKRKSSFLDALPLPLKKSPSPALPPPSAVHETELFFRSMDERDRWRKVIDKSKVFQAREHPTSNKGLIVTAQEQEELNKPIDLYGAESIVPTWTNRLKKLCMNVATHGIEIQNVHVDHPLVTKYFQDKKGHLELSVWDFAGQHEYYNNHHYFLTARTVFLVLWRMDNGTEGMQGLAFWLRSLSSHLSNAENSLFSIIVVGTFRDMPNVEKGERAERDRENKVRTLAYDSGLTRCHIQVVEVSCGTLENIALLQDKIYEAILSHSYMGERIPRTYLSVLSCLKELREEAFALANRPKVVLEAPANPPVPPKAEPSNKMRARVMSNPANAKDDGMVPFIPPVDLSEFVEKIGDEELVKRALSLFSLWGECVYFEKPAEISNIAILDPSVLTKRVLAQLFKPNVIAYSKDGTIKHSDLFSIWGRFGNQTDEEFWELAPKLIALMEKFEVCFPMEKDSKLPFKERKSVVPNRLPKRGDNPKDNEFRAVWPKDPPHSHPIEIERSLLFNILPMELVGRMLVRVHNYIYKNLVWRDQVVIWHPDNKALAWIRASIDKNSFTVSLRGSDKEACAQFMSSFASVVNVACQTYGGVTWQECIRSPYTSSALVPLVAIREDRMLPLGERTLTCPGTKFPLSAEILLSIGGYETYETPSGTNWWDRVFNVAPESDLPPEDHSQPLAAQKHHDFSIAFATVVEALQIDPNQFTTTAVHHPLLRLTFENSLELLAGKHTDTGSIFKKDDWMNSAAEYPLRKQTLFHLSQYIARIRRENWNDGQTPIVIPVVQRMPLKLAKIISHYGFKLLPPSRHSYYGQGIYFSTSLKYLNQYKNSDKDADEVYLVSLVAPGNPFPVIERHDSTASLAQKGCKPGYQSHYAVVDPDGILAPDVQNSPQAAGELVIFDPSHALPLFILRPKEPQPVKEPAPAVLREEFSFRITSEWKDLPPARHELTSPICGSLEVLLAPAPEQSTSEFTGKITGLMKTATDLVRALSNIAEPEQKRYLLLFIQELNGLMKVAQNAVEAGNQTPTQELGAIQELLSSFLEEIESPKFASILDQLQGRNCWWAPSMSWGENLPTGHLISIVDGAEGSRNETLFPKFEKLLSGLGWDVSSVEKAFWIHNPILARLFDSTRESITAAQRINEKVFKDLSWKDSIDSNQKMVYMDALEKLTNLFGEQWDNGKLAPVVPLIQGTGENAGLRIAKNGFGTVGSTDAGYYGQGTYFTSQVSYAREYNKHIRSGRVFLVSLVIPGNAFPITESPLLFYDREDGKEDFRPNGAGFLGKPCQRGYQSHITLVTKGDIKKAFPIEGQYDPKIHADEIVVFDATQSLPLFLVYSANPREFGENTPVVQPSPSDAEDLTAAMESTELLERSG